MIISLYKTIFYSREDPLLFIPMNDLDPLPEMKPTSQMLSSTLNTRMMRPLNSFHPPLNPALSLFCGGRSRAHKSPRRVLSFLCLLSLPFLTYEKEEFGKVYVKWSKRGV